MKRYLQRNLRLWRDNPLYSWIVVFSTALIITLSMLFYMVYAVQTNDLAPESNRSQMLKSTAGFSWDDVRYADYNRGMSSVVAKRLFEDLEGVETVSYTTNPKISNTSAHVGTSPDNSHSRSIMRVDDAFFKIFDFEFVAGAPFTKEQSDAHRGDVIITDRLAKHLYGTTDVVGKTVLIAYREHKITGVVKAVSSIFTNSYSELWLTFDPTRYDRNDDAGDLRGVTMAFLLVKKGYPVSKVKRQLAQRIEELNDNPMNDYVFDVGVEELGTIGIQTTMDYKDIWAGSSKTFNGGWLFAFVIGLILLIPAVNMAGIHSSQIEKRLSEVAVRKCYGANNGSVILHFSMETLGLTIVGGVVGLALSFISIALFKEQLLGSSDNFFATEGSFSLPASFFFSPWLYLSMILFCLIINTLSAVFPIWRATRTPIAETLKS